MGCSSSTRPIAAGASKVQKQEKSPPRQGAYFTTSQLPTSNITFGADGNLMTGGNPEKSEFKAVEFLDGRAMDAPQRDVLYGQEKNEAIKSQLKNNGKLLNFDLDIQGGVADYTEMPTFHYGTILIHDRFSRSRTSKDVKIQMNQVKKVNKKIQQNQQSQESQQSEQDQDKQS